MRLQTVPSPAVDVLIVEDDALTRVGLRQLLEGHGYRCAEAGDGREALVLARAEPPRCVLLDLILPVLDGFAVARKLRADLRTFSAHIYCLTGLQDELVHEQALRAGCEQLLAKPVDPADLLQAIRRQEERATAVVASGLSVQKAEDLLDWLENHGCTGLAFTREEDGFAVRFIPPHGLRPVQEQDGSLRLRPQEP